MKKRKFSLVLILSLSMFAFTSCDNEPLEGEFDTGSNSNLCSTVTQNTISASVNFASATAENFNELCLAYVSALEAQIAACGDPNGTVQAVINGLDC